MDYATSLQTGILITRYKRFMADIINNRGKKMTLYCPNTGAMTNCLYPNKRIWYSESPNPKRKYSYTWEQAEAPININNKEVIARIGVNTGKANALFKEWALGIGADLFCDYDTWRSEVRYGKNNSSRIDFLLQGKGMPECYIEVKSVTWYNSMKKSGLFPDAVTTRGTKHLEALTQLRLQGKRAILFFCVQHTEINQVMSADYIDPNYGKALRNAVFNGVEVMAAKASMSETHIKLHKMIPVKLSI